MNPSVVFVYMVDFCDLSDMIGFWIRGGVVISTVRSRGEYDYSLSC